MKSYFSGICALRVHPIIPPNSSVSHTGWCQVGVNLNGRRGASISLSWAFLSFFVASNSPRDRDIVTENIPQELKALTQWVLWRQEIRDGKPTKVPYQANGRRADATRPETWTAFSAAVNAYLKKPDQFSGVGFVFSKDDPCRALCPSRQWPEKRTALLDSSLLFR